MKKTTILTAGIILFSSLLGATSTFAAEGGNYDSKGEITFKAGTNPESPLDPVNPDPTKPVVPVDPVDPTGPIGGTNGPLSIDYASSFQFGEQEILTTDKTYYAQVQAYTDSESVAKTGPNYVQVTDKRGTQKGWELSVVQKAQFATTEGEELAGAKLGLANGHAISDQQTGLNDTDKAAITPTATVSTGETGLVPGAKTVIMTAAEKQGVGTWLYDMGTADTAAESVSLLVPGKSVKLRAAYKTTLTWTLSDTPVAP
ncbi:hypothetical protein IGI37_003821 [Enterococcus sp. AZ194]|uniref:WxL domain-containing protein n=1 Tax=Enterococcus sp. AZ194 TaxID=2774629 RepID=UPI003F286556